MRFIRSLNHFLRAYSPMRWVRDFLRGHPAYTQGDFVASPRELTTSPTVYPDEIYENREPDFGDEIQQYGGDDQEISQPVFRTPVPDIPQPEVETLLPDYQVDRVLIESALESLFNRDVGDNGLEDISSEPSDDPSHAPEEIDEASYAEPLDVPFDESFDPPTDYPYFDASDETLDDRVEEAYGDVAVEQDDIYDDPYAEQSLEDIVDEAAGEPDDMPEQEPEPEPMDDPMHPYMPYGGFPFPPGG